MALFNWLRVQVNGTCQYNRKYNKIGGFLSVNYNLCIISTYTYILRVMLYSSEILMWNYDITFGYGAVCDPFVEHHKHHVQEQETKEHDLRNELEENWVATLEETEIKDKVH